MVKQTKFMVEAATAYQKVLSVIAQIVDLYLLSVCKEEMMLTGQVNCSRS